MSDAPSVSAGEGQGLRVLLRRAHESAMGGAGQSACGAWRGSFTQDRVMRLRRRFVADLEESLVPWVVQRPPPQSRCATKLSSTLPFIYRTRKRTKRGQSGPLATVMQVATRIVFSFGGVQATVLRSSTAGTEQVGEREAQEGEKMSWLISLISDPIHIWTT